LQRRSGQRPGHLMPQQDREARHTTEPSLMARERLANSHSEKSVARNRGRQLARHPRLRGVRIVSNEVDIKMPVLIDTERDGAARRVAPPHRLPNLPPDPRPKIDRDVGVEARLQREFHGRHDTGVQAAVG